MSKIVVLSVAILMASIPALAVETVPFLGFSLQMNNPTGDFADNDLQPGDGIADPGGGVELDVGLANAHVMAYVGLRANKFDVDSPDNWQGEWSANRLAVGVRANLGSNSRAPVLPTIGGGITVGRTKLEGGMPFELETKRKSDTSIGWFIEGGVNARLSDAADLLANLQYHAFEAEFDEGPYVEQFDISFVTLQVGVAVYLGNW